MNSADRLITSKSKSPTLSPPAHDVRSPHHEHRPAVVLLLQDAHCQAGMVGVVNGREGSHPPSPIRTPPPLRIPHTLPILLLLPPSPSYLPHYVLVLRSAETRPTASSSLSNAADARSIDGATTPAVPAGRSICQGVSNSACSAFPAASSSSSSLSSLSSSSPPSSAAERTVAGTRTSMGSLSASTLTRRAGRADRVRFRGGQIWGGVGGGDFGAMRGRNGDWRV
jgi:hypothetical protein